MAIPGLYTLVSETVTTAVTAQAQTAIDSLEGMTRATFEATFSGTGGSTAVALIQSRMGSAGAWREIASIDFAAAGSKSCTVLTAAGTPAAFATLSANSVLNWLGTELRAVITSTGTWASGALAVRVHVT
jgi:hypothetical protein